MKILDVFSWLPENELSIEEIKNIAVSLHDGNVNSEGYVLGIRIPESAEENVIISANELVSEGKKVCFLIREGKVISVVGYRD